MGYTQEHTRRTRARIIEAAGRLFRRHGFHGVGIDDLMAEAGLTRGGFYAHFRSKEDLFVSVLAEELEFTTRLRGARAESSKNPRRAAAQRVAYYLAPENLARVGAACTMAANISDLGRTSHRARSAFTQSFGGLVEEFRDIVAPQRPDREARALAAIATCVGAITLARALTDRAAAISVLESSENAVMRELGFRVRNRSD